MEELRLRLQELRATALGADAPAFSDAASALDLAAVPPAGARAALEALLVEPGTELLATLAAARKNHGGSLAWCSLQRAVQAPLGAQTRCLGCVPV
jgi:hypothetical protein